MPIKIDQSSFTGPHFSRRKLVNVVLPLAEALAALPGVTDTRVYYEAPEDYLCVAFQLQGCEYLVKYYKVFFVNRMGGAYDDGTHFYNDYNNVVRFFECGYYRRWFGLSKE